MRDLEEAAKEFLSQRRIAVAGVSRSSNEAANIIFRKLRDSGREVLPVNPRTAEVEGVTCYPDLASIPNKPDAVFILTKDCRTHHQSQGIKSDLVSVAIWIFNFIRFIRFHRNCIHWLCRWTAKIIGKWEHIIIS